MPTLINIRDLACDNGITVEFWQFPQDLWAVYLYEPYYGPIIGLADFLYDDTQLQKVVLAHELGHHFTYGASGIPMASYTRNQRTLVSKAERKANDWAAAYLMPLEEVMQTIEGGYCWYTDLAEAFDVPLWFVQYRMEMPDISGALVKANREEGGNGLVAEKDYGQYRYQRRSL